MSEEIQRFEYTIWFEGDWISPMDIADSISEFIKSRGNTPLRAGYGTLMVAPEDVGKYSHMEVKK